MAPPMKSRRKSTEPKKCKSISMNSITPTQNFTAPPPLESKFTDSDWWDSFWHKNSASVPTLRSNEAEGFKYFFRVSMNTFEYICSLVRENLISRPPSGLINIEGRLLSVEKQVAIAMRRLATGDSQVSVGRAFGVGQSTVSQVTWRFIEAMEERARHHLKWPEPEQMEVVKSNFEDSFGLPNCCGAIDATHIIMTLPAIETSDDWCDKANNYSMFLQVIVDDQMRFLDIVTGWPGGMTVCRMLKCSGFYKLCENRDRLNGNIRTSSRGDEIKEYIVGGTSFPLRPWLITPYNNTSLSGPMASFNAKHRAASSLAGKAFLQLKGTWRILQKVMWRPDKRKLPSIVLVCCLLHNIILDRGDKLQQDVPLSDHHDLGYTEESCLHTDPSGEIMRENLTKFVPGL
ncbi:Basic amino-acid permease [Ranunculus cassubicifolius]